MKHENAYAVLDLETSGLSEAKGVAMEIAVVILDTDLKEKERYEAYIKPYKDIQYHPGALQAHGIPIQTTIDEGKDITVVCKEVAALFNKYKGKGRNKKIYVVGHNLFGFDLKWLIDMFLHAKPKMDFKTLYEIELDTMWLARIKYGNTDDMTNFKLGTCCAKEEIALVDAHRAMNDTVATSKLLISYLNNLRSDGDSRIVEEDRFRDTFYF